MRLQSRKQFAPFVFYTVAATVLGVAAQSGGARPPLTSIIVLLITGLVSWAVIEYVLHRFAFHRLPSRHVTAHRGLISASHEAHHDRPQAIDRLFASLGMSVPVALCYCLLAWGVTGDWRSMTYLFIGLVCGYFGYEWLHYQAHHGSPRARPLRYLRKYHLLHHHQTPDLRFGVTSPLIDYLFGTFRPAREGKRVDKKGGV